MASRVSLVTLLSQTLVAFTIEFDNEAEHRLPHSTTNFGRTPGALTAPWLASMAMWFNCMQHVPEQGIALRELHRRARTGTNVDGMQRWGYISLTPDPADERKKPPKADWLVRAKAGGRLAQSIWQPLFAVIEARWRERFGAATIQRLRDSLASVVRQLDPNLPDCLPIVGYGLFSAGPPAKKVPRTASAYPADPGVDVAGLPLPALLARVVLAVTIEFEQTCNVSLAMSQNLLRVLDERPIRLRDLPGLTGISNELIAVATGWLGRHGYAVLEKIPSPDKGKQIRLTEKGLLAQESHPYIVQDIEKRFRSLYGATLINELREILLPIVQDGSAEKSPMFQGLTPYPDGWRAKVRKPAILPHFPLVTHRGGYPDGS